MANYDLVVNSTFQPFSFERYIQPYQLYGQAYKEQEAYIDALEQGANSYKERAVKEMNSNKDSKWANKYLQYATDLENAANTLAQQGLNASTRGNIRGLKTRYYDTVIPVEKAIQRQAELAKIADSANPATRSLYGEMPSIDALIETPTLGRESYSGAAVEQSAMQAANAASLRKVTEYFGKSNLPLYLRKGSTVGFSAKEMEKFRQDFKYIPELNRIFEDVESQFGNFKGMNKAQKNQLRGEILSGIMKGAMYKQTNDYMVDQGALEALRASRARAAARAAAKGAEKDLPNALNIPEYSIDVKIDTKAQSDQLRRKLARKTADFLVSNARDKKLDYSNIRRFNDKFRISSGKNKGKIDYYKMVDYLEKYGVGDTNLIYSNINTKSNRYGKQFTATGNALRNYLREEGLTNEKALDIWTNSQYNDKGTVYYSPTPKGYDSGFLGLGQPIPLGINTNKDIKERFTNALNDTYKTQGRHLIIDKENKKNLLSIAINQSGDIKGPYSGIFKVGNLDFNSNKLTRSRLRVKKEDLPRDAQGNLNYDAIDILRVNGGLVLTWGEGKQGFIPDDKLSSQIQRQVLESDYILQQHLQPTLDIYRTNLYSTGQFTPEVIEQLVENKKQHYLNEFSRKSAEITARGGQGLNVKDQEIE